MPAAKRSLKTPSFTLIGTQTEDGTDFQYSSSHVLNYNDRTSSLSRLIQITSTRGLTDVIPFFSPSIGQKTRNSICSCTVHDIRKFDATSSFWVSDVQPPFKHASMHNQSILRRVRLYHDALTHVFRGAKDRYTGKGCTRVVPFSCKIGVIKHCTCNLTQWLSTRI